MMEHQPRRVTRGYTWWLIAAVAIVAATVLIVAWGTLSYFTGVDPVTSNVSSAAAPLIVFVALALLVWSLWLQALEIVRGRTSFQWSQALILAGGGYLIWSLGGLAMGLGINETWFSPFALILAVIWGLVPVLFWLVLLRRLYSDKSAPRWPWEKPGADHHPEDDLEK